MKTSTIYRSLLSITLLILLCAIPSHSQSFTTVTGTVTDTSSTPYANGSLTISLSNTSTQQATFGGSPNFQQVYVLSLNSSGAFSTVLPSNAIILPANTQWSFAICSVGNYGCATALVTISGASQDVSASLSNLAHITWPSSASAPPGGTGQSITSLGNGFSSWGNSGTGAPSGSCASGGYYTDTSTGNVYSCKNGAWQQVASGSGTVVSSTQFSAPYYSSATAITGVTAPTTPNNVAFTFCSIPASGVATIPAWCWPGVAVNAQTGASYTILASDRGSIITASNSGAQTYTVPDGGTLNFGNNFNFAVKNINSGTVTLTRASVSTFNCADLLAVTTCAVTPGETAYVYLNPANNWEVVIVGQPVAKMNTAGQAGFLPFFVTNPIDGAGTSLAFSANQVHVYQFVLPFQATIRNASVFVNTGQAASHVDMGLYDSTCSNLLVHTGALSSTVSSAFVSGATTATYVAQPGVYFWAVTTDNAGVVLGSRPQITFSENLVSGTFGNAANASVSGVLPASCGAVTNANIQVGLGLLYP